LIAIIEGGSVLTSGVGANSIALRAMVEMTIINKKPPKIAKVLRRD